MKIGLNATCINSRPSGANQRFAGIYKELFLLMPNSEFIIYHSVDCDLSSWFSLPNVRYIKTPIHSEGGMGKFFYNLTYWNRQFQKEEFDYFECFNLPIVDSKNCKIFHTIHDIRSISLPSSKLHNFFSKMLHSQAINKANKIITVSDSMKAEILRFFPDADIFRLYNGIDIESFQSIEEGAFEIVKSKLTIPENFLLSVGHFEHRKNYGNLIDAIYKLKCKGIFKPLVIIGNDNGTKEEIQKKIYDLGLKDQVHIFSNINNNDFKSIYQMCDIFVFPSIYEGFGIPILEAMACNKPIVLSQIPVFEEITQMKCLYFNPADHSSIANALEKMIFNKELAKASIDYGAKRINDFSFTNIASELKSLYIT